MTALDLTQLAADCEARAKAGEKPSDQWAYKPSEGDRYDFEGLIFVNPFEGKWYARWHPMVPAINRATPLSSLTAAQLFAEALLREATGPLHAARVRRDWDEIAARFSEVKVLGDNWDADGASRPTTAAIATVETALGVAEKIGAPPAFLCPVTDGGIAVHWKHGEAEFIVEGRPDGSLSISVADYGGESIRSQTVDLESKDAHAARIAALEAALAEAPTTTNPPKDTTT